MSSTILTRDSGGRRSVSIPLEEVSFHPHSFADDAGRLFSWEGRLYRGINSKHAHLFERLLRDGVVQNLVERGLLVATERTDLSLDGYAMVVRHRTVPFVSYPNEWCAAMLKEAGLAIISLTIELVSRNLTLKDAHPWNVLFDASKPVYVDLTSIAFLKEDSRWPAYDEFCRFCYYPLILMAHGHERIARSVLPEYRGVQRKELLALMRGSAPSGFMFSKLLRRGLRPIQSIIEKKVSGRKPALALLKRMKREIENIRLPFYESKQGELRDESITSLSSGFNLTPKQRVLRRILAELEPDTVLDLSRGAVWTSILPSVMGSNVVSADADPSRSTAIYQIARDKGLEILPLIVDFIKPTPAIGYSGHYSIAATERLKCDMVLAFGLAQRLVSENHFIFDLIAEGLSSFSKRWLLLDFDLRENDSGYGGCDTNLETSAVDGLVFALRKRFREVRTVSSNTGRGVVLLCEK